MGSSVHSASMCWLLLKVLGPGERARKRGPVFTLQWRCMGSKTSKYQTRNWTIISAWGKNKAGWRGRDWGGVAVFSWLSGQERSLHRGHPQPCAELKERQLGRAVMPMPWHLWKPFWATHVLADLPHLSKISSELSLSPTSSSGWEEAVFTGGPFFARAADTLPNYAFTLERFGATFCLVCFQASCIHFCWGSLETCWSRAGSPKPESSGRVVSGRCRPLP